MTGAVSTIHPPMDSAKPAPRVEQERDKAPSAASTFNGVHGHFLNRGRGLEFDMEARWVREHLRSAGGKVLDLGCGIGALVPSIGLERAIGVDYCGDGLVHTRARFPNVPLTCAAAEQLPFADASFSAITLQHVVEHITATGSSAAEWCRVLKPKGTLLVLTPNASFSDPCVFDDPTHVQLFDRHDLPGLLKSVGFEIVDLRTIGLPWFRRYGRIPSGWRLRRFVTRNARSLSAFGPLRWKGQTLCCVARRPVC